MEKNKKENKEEFAINFGFLQKNWKYFILGAILIFGFYLRFYHIAYPVIGYHNWKTAHYITEARNFAREGFFKHGFFVPMRDTLENIREPPDGQHTDSFPTISIIVAVFFKIFGESLVIARLINILFSLGSVIAFYFLIKELFDRESLALLSAFLAALNPLFVFFSHNVQLENPGLFFMLFGAYFFIKWMKNKKNIFLYTASFFVMFSIATKYSFGIIAFPILFVLPYKSLLRKKMIKPIIISALLLSFFPLWFIYSEFLLPKETGPSELTKIFDFSIVFDKGFWNTMKLYVADNFTLIGIVFALIGFILFLFLLAKNYAKTGYKFMAGYFIGCFLYFFIMGYKMSGHNYHQFPIAPLVIFFMAFFMEVIASNASLIMQSSVSSKLMIYLIVFLIIIFLLPPGKSLYTESISAKNRMFDTQFPGLDIAGEYIREHSSTNERFFHSSGQSFGILWHAGIKGYKPPKDAEYFKKAENEFNVSWVFAYQWGLQSYCILPELFRFECTDTQKEIFQYLQDNYRLVQFGFIANNQQVQPIYFLFRKGGKFNSTILNELMQGQNKKIRETKYHYTYSDYVVTSIDFE